MFPDITAKTIERVASIADFTDNQSNAIRGEQSFYLVNEFYNYPILGKGFGSTLSSGFIRDDKIPYTFELSYLELLYKLGVVGFSVFLIGLLWLVNTIYKSPIRQRKVLLISLICLLFVSFTNPYIVSALGMFLLSVLYAVSKDTELLEDVIT